MAIASTPLAVAAYGAAFPADGARAAALAACARDEAAFNRWFAADRAACYARLLEPLPAPPPPVPRRLQVASREG